VNHETERILDLKSIKTLNPKWTEFYQTRIADFSPAKFELKESWKEDNLITGNILADYNPDFNKNHFQFLINSPDKSQYIDLDYYNLNIIKNPQGEFINQGYEVDQEINWVNRNKKEIKRIGFHGTISKIEDAKWIDNSTVVLFGLFENKLTLKFCNLNSQEFELFIYPDTLRESESYSEKLRLKNVKFE
jgi:hypothetical protein